VKVSCINFKSSVFDSHFNWYILHCLHCLVENVLEQSVFLAFSLPVDHMPRCVGATQLTVVHLTRLSLEGGKPTFTRHHRALLSVTPGDVFANYPDIPALIGNGSILVSDFGIEVGGIATIDFTSTDPRAIRIACKVLIEPSTEFHF